MPKKSHLDQLRLSPMMFKNQLFTLLQGNYIRMENTGHIHFTHIPIAAKKGQSAKKQLAAQKGQSARKHRALRSLEKLNVMYGSVVGGCDLLIKDAESMGSSDGKVSAYLQNMQVFKASVQNLLPEKGETMGLVYIATTVLPRLAGVQDIYNHFSPKQKQKSSMFSSLWSSRDVKPQKWRRSVPFSEKGIQNYAQYTLMVEHVAFVRVLLQFVEAIRAMPELPSIMKPMIDGVKKDSGLLYNLKADIAYGEAMLDTYEQHAVNKRDLFTGQVIRAEHMDFAFREHRVSQVESASSMSQATMQSAATKK